MSLNSWPKILNKIGKKSNEINSGLYELLEKNIKEIKKKWPKKLPSGIIHGDLFIDNIFFKNNKFHGYIDFYFACLIKAVLALRK